MSVQTFSEAEYVTEARELTKIVAQQMEDNNHDGLCPTDPSVYPGLDISPRGYIRGAVHVGALEEQKE